MIPSAFAGAAFGVPHTASNSEETDWTVERPPSVQVMWGAPFTLTEPHVHVQPLHPRQVTPAVVVNGVSDAELRTMRAQIEELSREVKELRSRVMEASIEVASIGADAKGEEAVVDPHLHWIEEHEDEIRSYPRMWLAIHAQRGIVFHAKTADELEDQLDTLRSQERSELMTFNTTPYT